MSKIKVLTVMFDVTHLSQEAIDSLQQAAIVQAEDFEVGDTGVWEYDVPVLNTSVREVDASEDA